MSIVTIAIDAMGGDFGPSVIIPSVVDALKQHTGLRIILVGDRAQILEYCHRFRLQESEALVIHHASEVVGMDELPGSALRFKKDSSMRVAINLVKQGEAQACVSAGNTGALMATARFVLKTLPGIDRPAISAVLPTMKKGKTVRILDLGANIDCSGVHLFQFAVMGAVLASAVSDITNPSVGLLNIGEESIKGTEQIKQATKFLENTPQINYIGYIEGDNIYRGEADVIVCDGFAGNVALKTSEGLARFIAGYIKEAFSHNWLSKLSALAAKHVLNGLATRLDPAQYNGASFVGLKGTVIKSHGSANVAAFTNAIHEAILEVEKDVPQRISVQVTELLQQGLDV